MGYEAQLGVQTLNLDKDILEGVETEEQLDEMMPKKFVVGVTDNQVENVLEEEFSFK